VADRAEADLEVVPVGDQEGADVAQAIQEIGRPKKTCKKTVNLCHSNLAAASWNCTPTAMGFFATRTRIFNENGPILSCQAR